MILMACSCFAQNEDVRGKRLIADQSIYLQGYRIDTIKNDTSNLALRIKTIMTAKSVYDFVNGRYNILLARGIDDVLGIGQSLAANRTLDLNGNRFTIQGNNTGKFYAEFLREMYLNIDDNTFPQILFRGYGDGSGGNHIEISSTGSPGSNYGEQGLYGFHESQTDSTHIMVLWSGNVPTQTKAWPGATSIILSPQKIRFGLRPQIEKNWVIYNLHSTADSAWKPMAYNPSDSSVKYLDHWPNAAGTTLYSGDGTISSNRTITGAGKSLTWNSAGNMEFNLGSSKEFTINGTNLPANVSQFKVSAGEVLSHVESPPLGPGTSFYGEQSINPDRTYMKMYGSVNSNEIALTQDSFVLDPVNGELYIYRLDAGAATDSVLVWDAATRKVKYRDAGAFGSSGDFWPLTGTATLAANTEINTSGNDLTIGENGRSILWGSSSILSMGDNEAVHDNLLFTIDAANNIVKTDNTAHNTKFGINTVPTVALEVVGDIMAQGASSAIYSTSGSRFASNLELFSDTHAQLFSADNIGNGKSSIIETRPSQGSFMSATNGSNDTASFVDVKMESITFKPDRGKLFADTLTANVGTKALRWNPSTGLISYADTTTGGSASAPGNYGNMLLNRNGIISTPGADSVLWDGNLKLKSSIYTLGKLIFGDGTNGNVSTLLESPTGTINFIDLNTADWTHVKLKNLTSTGSGIFGVDLTTPLIYGGTDANGDIIIKGTSNGTKTTSYVTLQEDGGNVAIGVSSASHKLTIEDNQNSLDIIKIKNNHASGYASIGFFNSANTQVGGFGYANSGVVGAVTDAVYFYTNGKNMIFSKDVTSTSSMNLNSGGTVGITSGLYIGSATTVPTTKLQVSGNLAIEQGVDVASANDVTLVTNLTEITGTTQVNHIASTNWVNGSEITLMFSGNVTVKNNQATSGANIKLLLAGGADFNATADDVIKFVLGEIGGTIAWREVSRSVN
jgi:hypothetical protein